MSSSLAEGASNAVKRRIGWALVIIALLSVVTVWTLNQQSNRLPSFVKEGSYIGESEYGGLVWDVYWSPEQMDDLADRIPQFKTKSQGQISVTTPDLSLFMFDNRDHIQPDLKLHIPKPGTVIAIFRESWWTNVQRRVRILMP